MVYLSFPYNTRQEWVTAYLGSLTIAFVQNHVGVNTCQALTKHKELKDSDQETQIPDHLYWLTAQLCLYSASEHIQTNPALMTVLFGHSMQTLYADILIVPIVFTVNNNNTPIIQYVIQYIYFRQDTRCFCDITETIWKLCTFLFHRRLPTILYLYTNCTTGACGWISPTHIYTWTVDLALTYVCISTNFMYNNREMVQLNMNVVEISRNYQVALPAKYGMSLLLKTDFSARSPSLSLVLECWQLTSSPIQISGQCLQQQGTTALVNLKYGDIAVYLCSMSLCNALRYPDDVTALLLLQLHIGVEYTQMELL